MSENEADLGAVGRLCDGFLAERAFVSVAPTLKTGEMAAWLSSYDFAAPQLAATVAEDLLDFLGQSVVRTNSPRYFGLFNPPALPAAIKGDLLAATVNPQLALASHAPGAVAIERKLIELFHTLVGWHGDRAGNFTSGGSEANLTAVLEALARRYPEWHEQGLRSDGLKPAIYCSAKAHMAWIKIARKVGLGSAAVRTVEPADGLRLDGETLSRALADDAGLYDPFLIVATAGTTSHGAIDDLAGLTEVAARHGAHCHVDAAWAGGALFVPAMRHHFAGIEHADSITIDPHKMLSVPMGAGLYLTRNWRSLETAFQVATDYMPASFDGDEQPYLRSLQWSRRCIGLKLFTMLAVLGTDGVVAMIEKQNRMAHRLREGLERDGWRVVNDTWLPLVCFTSEGATDRQIEDIAAAVVDSGKAWISVVRLREVTVLRACITSYQTEAADLGVLLDVLRDARERLAT